VIYLSLTYSFGLPEAREIGNGIRRKVFRN
jgi:hypothetical protein